MELRIGQCEAERAGDRCVPKLEREEGNYTMGCSLGKSSGQCGANRRIKKSNTSR